MFTILIAYAIYTIRIRLPRGKIIAPLLALFLVVSSLVTSVPLIGHVEYEGAIDNMKTFADHFTNDDFIVFEPERTGILFARPLWFIYGKKAVMLNDLNPEEFEQMLKEQQNEPGGVYFIWWQSKSLVEKLGAQSHVEMIANKDLGQFRIFYPQYTFTYLDLNMNTRDMVFNLHIYEARYKE